MNTFEIIYCDEYIVAAVKPCGVLSEGEFPDMLAQALAKRDGQRADGRGGLPPRKLYTVHRLDKPTEGLLVYARTSAAAAALSQSLQRGEWKKIYIAALTKAPAEQEGELSDLLFYDRQRGKSFIASSKRKGVHEARLSYTAIGTDTNKTVGVAVTLGSGRTHQIRVQFASRGMPLCGDRQYGAPPEHGSRLALASVYLSLPHPVSGEQIEFTATPDNPIVRKYYEMWRNAEKM